MTTIRQQLTRKLVLTVGLVIAAGGLAVYLAARAALQFHFDAALRAKAQALTTLTEQKGDAIEVDFSGQQLPAFEAGGSDFFELRRTDGTLLERSRSLAGAPLPLPGGAVETPSFADVSLPNDQPGRAVGIRFRPHLDDAPDGTKPTEILLVVASSRRDLDRTLLTLQLVLAGAGLLLLSVTGLLAPRLLRRELSPLQRIADHAARLDAASLFAHFPAANLPGELVPIAARLNELLARLEDSFERERRFSSNVAHEFRTPVAELRSLAELVIRMPDARTADTDRDVLAIALHLERILTQLLALARGERSELPAQRERVQLAPLVENVCRKFQDKAAARRLSFAWHVPDQAETDSDAVLLRSILAQLVDNAVEYTPPGGAVELEARLDGGRLAVRVSNSVDTLEPGDLPRLFEPFWRKDAARAVDGHTGLGLSVAQTFAHALGCNLTAAFAAPGRLAITLAQAADDNIR